MEDEVLSTQKDNNDPSNNSDGDNRVGDKVTITYIRDGVTKQVEATLGEIASNH